ncbi:hypothetical protein CH272_18410 [Rhodococcus sp. 05-340-1]|nr:hypothetical protein CH254_14395 [Rhodococcus sp. 06-412-2C]OZC96399.1 hypothetical protein CH279_14565 [Rhodococcus sp. 06-412-2B]OZD65383.1 hypothetical protein CH271_20385 [Rhodococcus sp. 05-340-2]OZD74571.1 hypothetical protein CH272_18410 [Rhodococcus sp. 05-340-1]OZD86657.1 hypothetical protein CH273_00620 [Rhodococcus sp. 05-339-2]
MRKSRAPHPVDVTAQRHERAERAYVGTPPVETFTIRSPSDGDAEPSTALDRNELDIRRTTETTTLGDEIGEMSYTLDADRCRMRENWTTQL